MCHCVYFLVVEQDEEGDVLCLLLFYILYMGKGCWGLIFRLSMTFCLFVFELIVIAVDLLGLQHFWILILNLYFFLSLSGSSVPSQIEQIAHLNLMNVYE